MKVEIYSDIACPWCYVGKTRFERALAAFPKGSSVEVVYRPFQLDPSAPHEARPHHEVLAAKFGARAAAMDRQIAALGAEEGIAFEFDTVLENNSLLAHRLLRFTLEEYGPEAQVRLKGRLMAGHFGEGMDIGDHEHLTDAAVAVGLDRDAVAAFLSGDELHDEVLDDIDEARRLGITAVPTFVFEGKWAVQGGQETSVFLQALEQVARDTAAEHAAEDAALATDDAGACADGVCEVPAADGGAAR
ncbi:DsbA family oxidoreductase [Actinacidiphila bryophytorum]|uniref:Predicted dithiol-disulfide isomerase, DsbA family n=1 Tax=Actinacidiphila bryophytorum TaxID=1436133 RepID=A0A9W4MJ04_9ACTN|nr:DsbA family oxidoreductase [Actinacidiphila bryophytorum]MBM9436022.1 DsbA family oxidoreductase [Actinacidiphila bryophytorum]MBN6546916.1 DsbA family oxidoreductase [Actinacidiphila bryophytorum]CAG7649089.1 Predicted dithiol-disulfide isomerase, DsbA family [Actinacidiphila bryophytorum]